MWSSLWLPLQLCGDRMHMHCPAAPAAVGRQGYNVSRASAAASVGLCLICIYMLDFHVGHMADWRWCHTASMLASLPGLFGCVFDAQAAM